MRLGCDGDVDSAEGGSLVECWTCGGKRADCPTCAEYSLGRDVVRAVRVPRCPRQALTLEVGGMLTAYGMYKEGALPIVGGWMDQAATYVEGVRFVAGLVAEHEKPKDS